MATTIAEKLASQLLCKLDITQSDFVRGFLMKCASVEYNASDTVRAINDAVSISPHISHEFEVCGFEKTSSRLFGSAPKAPGAPAAPIKAPAAAAAPAAPFKPVGSLFGKGPRPTPPKMPATFNPGGDSPSPSMLGSAARGLGQGALNVFNVPWGMAKGVAGRTLQGVGAAAKPLAWATDTLGITQHATPAVGAFTDSLAGDAAAGFADVGKAFNPAEAALPGSHNTARVHQHQQEMLSRGQNWSSGFTGAFDNGGKMLTNMLLGGGVLGAASKLGPVSNMLQKAAPVMDKVGPLLNYGGQTLGAGAAQWAAQPVAAESATPPVATQENPVVTDQQPPEMQPSVSAAPGAAPPAPTAPPPSPEAQPAAAGQQPAPQPASLLTQTPEYKEVSTLVQNDPETATQLGQQAVGQIKQSLDTPEGAAELGALKNTGKLSPDGQQKAMTALTENGYDWDHAQNTIMNMDGWEQLGLWGGLSLTALGLLHALGGEGGVGSLLIGMLGLGAAGFTAAKTGLLDQGSQDMANSMQTAVMGEPSAAPPATPAAPPAAASAGAPGMIDQLKTKAVDTWNNAKPKLQAGAFEAIKPQIPSMIDKMPDQPDPTTAKMLLSLVPPDAAAELDMAIGHGGAGNAIASFLGDFGNTTQKRMTERLGTTPEQNDKLLRQWAYARKTGQ